MITSCSRGEIQLLPDYSGMRTFLFCLLLLSVVNVFSLRAQNISQLKKQAESGNDTARLKLAEIFALGLDVPANQDSVVHYLRPLLKKEHPEACFLMGNSKLRGFGVSKNIPEGLKYLEIAAKHKSVQAVHVLMEVYSGRDASGPFTDPVLLAQKNNTSFFRIASMAPLLHEPVSAYNLGVCYLKGLGTTKNDSLALKWLEYAAGWEYCRAQLVLGDIWFFNSVNRGYDLDKAYTWYSKANQNTKCSLEDKGNGLEGMIWVDRMFHMLWNQTLGISGMFREWRIELPVPEVKEKDFVRKRWE